MKIVLLYVIKTETLIQNPNPKNKDGRAKWKLFKIRSKFTMKFEIRAKKKDKIRGPKNLS